MSEPGPIFVLSRVEADGDTTALTLTERQRRAVMKAISRRIDALREGAPWLNPGAVEPDVKALEEVLQCLL